MLSNLIGNAIKFTPEGGSLSLRVSPEGDFVRFALSDTGPGIPADELPRLFDRYWNCLLYTSDAADERSSVDLGGRRIIKKKNMRQGVGVHETSKTLTH